MWLRRTLPTWTIAPLGWAIATVAWLFMSQKRRVLDRNVQELCGPQPPAVRRRLVRQTFRNYVRIHSDILALPLASPASLLAMVDVHGRGHLDRALASGRGIFIAFAHVGNWELLVAVLPAMGVPLHVIFEPITPERDALMATCRAKPGVTLIPGVPGSARVAARALERGEVVMTGADRALGTARSLTVRFGLGRRPVPTGPAWMALEAGATVIPALVVLNDSGGRPYRLIIEPAIEVPAGTGNSIEALATAIGARLGGAAARYPDQWLVFSPDWQDSVPKTTSTSGP